MLRFSQVRHCVYPLLSPEQEMELEQGDKSVEGDPMDICEGLSSQFYVNRSNHDIVGRSDVHKHSECSNGDRGR